MIVELAISPERTALLIVQALRLWMFAPAGKSMLPRQRAWAAMKKIQRIIPEELKEAPPILYRVMMIQPAQLKEINTRITSGQKVVKVLEKRPFSSWTTSAAFAKHFADSFAFTGRAKDISLVLRREIPQTSVVLNVPRAYQYVTSILSKRSIQEELGSNYERFVRWFKSEKEIIVKNDKTLTVITVDDIYRMDGDKVVPISSRGSERATDSVSLLQVFKTQLVQLRKEFADIEWTISVRPGNLERLNKFVVVIYARRLSATGYITLSLFVQRVAKGFQVEGTIRTNTKAKGGSYSVRSKVVVKPTSFRITAKSLGNLLIAARKLVGKL